MTNECREIQELLVEMTDGGLSPEERERVDRHLATCPACSDEAAALERTFRALRDDGYREPSPFYWTRFEAGLRRRLEGERGRAARSRALAPRLAPVAVAALCFIIGLWLGLRPSAIAPARRGIPVAEAPGTARSVPVISPESKLLVEAGLDRRAAYAADTLRPNALAPFGAPSEMILASSPRISAIEPGPGPRPTGR